MIPKILQFTIKLGSPGSVVSPFIWRHMLVKSTPNNTKARSSRGILVKKQQMRWCPKGAHLLLQVRTKVLNEELREKFNHWYPGFEKTEEAAKMAAELPQFFAVSILSQLPLYCYCLTMPRHRQPSAVAE